MRKFFQEMFYKLDLDIPDVFPKDFLNYFSDNCVLLDVC